ncbi:hypothetical protein YPPY16_0289, partial [Yersinia pestis PY-16]
MAVNFSSMALTKGNGIANCRLSWLASA